MQSFNDFCDVLWDIALKNEIVTKRDASDDKVFNILTDIYNTEFYKYEERGLYITIPDYVRCLTLLQKEMQSLKQLTT